MKRIALISLSLGPGEIPAWGVPVANGGLWMFATRKRALNVLRRLAKESRAMRIKFNDLPCCTDCALFLANGEGMGETWKLSDVEERWTSAELEHMVLQSTEPDEFSSTPCEICGSTLSGERHLAAVLEG